MSIINQLTNCEHNNNELITKIIEITENQHLTDVEDQLPKTNGIHAIITATGGGKTTRMMQHAHLTNGIVVFPVKAIKAQQELEKEKAKIKFRAKRRSEKHNEKFKQKRRKKRQPDFMFVSNVGKKPYQVKVEDLIPLSRTEITQIEKLDFFKFSDVAKIKGGSLHVDECQILYQGGFRKYVERLIRFIIKASQLMPVYLYSATVRLELLRYLNINTVTYVNKPFDREIKVIPLETTGVVKNNTNAIAIVLDAILRRSKDKNDEFDDVPILAFVNSAAMGMRVIAKLIELGHDANELMFMDSARIKRSKSDERKVFNNIINAKAIGGCGKRLIIATNVLAEGINIEDKLHVVSTQADAGTLFQQQGRARGDAYHWLICGGGMDTLEISENELIQHYIDEDGKQKRRTLQERSQLKDSRCDWYMNDARQAAIISSMLQEQFQYGRYGVQVLNELQAFGYTPKEHNLVLQEMKIRTERTEIPKREVIDLIKIHGCPIFHDVEHGLIKSLKKKYPLPFYERQLDKAVTWAKAWTYMTAAGIKLECWEVYDVVNQLGRSFLLWTFADGQRCLKVHSTVEDFKTLFIQELEKSKKEIKQVASDCKQGGRVPSNKLAIASEKLFSSVLNKQDEYEFWSDANQHMRITLFKLLTGFTVDNDQWSITVRDTWMVPFDNNAQRNKFNLRAKHIEKAGLTVKQFCESEALTTKDVANLSTKEVKAKVNDVVSQITF